MDYLIKMNRNLRIGILLSCFFIFSILTYIFDDFWFLFLILSFISLYLLIASNIGYDRYLQDSNYNLAINTFTKNNFNYDDYYVSENKLTAIAINEKSQQFAISYRNSINDSFNFKIINFPDIIESNIVEDGETVIKSSLGSIVGNSIAGGIIGGNIGAVVGGANANRTSKDKVKRISLIIVVNSLLSPTYEVNFMNFINPVDKENPLYKKRYSDVFKWHKIISVILKRNELNSKLV